MLTKLLAAIVIGGLIGGYSGYFLKCSGGTCPLTCNPWGGAFFGALIGVMIVIS